MFQRAICIFGLGLGLVLTAVPAHADLAAWDQARVTAIAKDLAQACDAYRLAVRQQPGDTIGSGEAEEEFRIIEKSEGLRERSETLAAHLAKGDGHDKTLDMYRSLKEVADDIEVESQRTEMENDTMAAWAKVADALRQIAPYYDPKADTK